MANEVAQDKPKKRNKVKEVFSELKKVTWPTSGKVVKQTATVLVVTVFFMLILLAMDQLLGLAYRQLTKGLTDTTTTTQVLASIGNVFSAGFTKFCALPLF